MDAQAVVDRLAAAWNANEPKDIAACYAEDAVMHHPFSPEALHGREAVYQLENTMFESFSGTSLEVLQVVVQDDWIVTRVRIRAKNTAPLTLPGSDQQIPATDKDVDLISADFIRVNGDGEIVEAHRYFDTMGVMAQLGLMG